MTSIEAATYDAILRERARLAALQAWCPYSKFRVGAAVLTHNRNIYSGCNVENSSYGLTMCAERVAMFAAVAAGAKPPFVAIAVACVDSQDNPEAVSGGNKLKTSSLTPCGACRQVMSELMVPGATVYVDKVGCIGLDQLLPYPFGLRNVPPEEAVKVIAGPKRALKEKS